MSNVYELATYMHNGAGNFFQNVFKFDLSETGVGIAPWEYADALISAFISGVETHYLALFGQDVTLDFYSARKINSGGGPAAQRVRGLSGGQAVVSVSSGASIDIQWQTGSPLNRPGHTYIAAFQLNAVQADVVQVGVTFPSPAFITAMLSNLTLTGALGTASPGVYTKKTNTFHAYTHGIVRPKVSMFNRRLKPQI